MDQGNGVGDALRFLQRNWLRVLTVSALVIVPCLWHRHIEAGDLGSHVYNAWLAQLIAKGQAPGLYVVPQWHNILFDLGLLHVGNWVGLAAAEKIVVSACVLIFFWGVFAFVTVVAGQAPWMFTPCIAMLSYGYSFNMGFLNYYLSIGLGCLCLALMWRDWQRNWIPAVVIAVLVTMAHPMGLVWVIGVVVYLAIRPALPGAWKLVVPTAVVAACSAFRWYVHRSNVIVADFYHPEPFRGIGVDQLVLYGKRYEFLGWAAVLFGIACFVLGIIVPRKEAGSWKRLEVPLELYLILFCAVSFAPENVRFFARRGLDRHAGFPPDDDFSDCGVVRSGICPAQEVAFHWIRGDSSGFLCFSVSGHRKAESHGGQRRDASVAASARGPRDPHPLCGARLAHSVHRSSGRSRVHTPMLRLFELRAVLEAVSRAGGEWWQLDRLQFAGRRQ